MTLQPIPFVLLLLALVIELCRGASISGCIADERNALLNLKKNVEDKHSRLASWKDEDCCNWEGVSCNNVTGHVVRLDLRNPYPCSDDKFNDPLDRYEFLDPLDRYVHDLFIQCNEWSLRGELSPSLVGLKQLKYLDLSWNQFDGPIPKFVGSLHNLRYLNLSQAGFHGFIPHHLGNLSRLKYLDLNNNIAWTDYDYIIGDSRWISHLTSLKHLTVTHTKFENFQNWIEALNELSNIVEIRLSSCDINAFPLSLPYVNFTNLSYLDLSSNSVDSEMIPLWLFKIKTLTHIDLHDNRFRSIPDALKNLTSLEYIDFSGNEFSGDFPQALKSLRKVHTLDLSNNYLKGILPNWLGELHRLESLDLSTNSINGYLPIWLGELHMLEYLDLSFNNINGSLPNWLGELHMLKSLHLSNNHLNGSLPNWLGELHMLKSLHLSYNKLNGSLPNRLVELHRLESLDLSENNINGYLPNWLGELHMLKYLDLSFNNINGSLPNSLGELHMLKSLHLSYNHLNGSLPNRLGELHRLESLDLSFNGLFGCIPESLGQLVVLQQLFLSGNNLNGTVPKYIGQLSNLVRLDLNGNSFVGVVSEVHFASLAKLKELDIGSNNLILNVSRDWIPPFKLKTIGMSSCKIGPEFPRWLNTQVNLSHLDLSSSHIVDILPNWFWNVFDTHDPFIWQLDLSNNGITGSLPHLSKLCFKHFNLSSNFLSGPLPRTLDIRGSLDISNNSFYGSISPFICNNTSYQMSLSRNNFSGKIPSCICLTNPDRLDLSWNLLTDELPNCWGTYNGISILDFSRNNLSGNIPHTLGTLTKLLILRLDNNILSGNIPSTLRNCTQLIFLDLSFNNLKGKIPLWFGENLNILEVLVLRSNNFTGNVPSNLSKLKFLRILSLSNNNLFGKIPRSFGNFTNMMDLHLHYTFQYYSSRENLELIIKGREWMYHELLSLITNIDLSCNELSGQIPTEIGNLQGLNFLNLSENHLIGSIPDEIGLMHSLESLDISKNGLSGNIPLSMSTMTTLDFLNLSYNNLSGRIPSGNELQTLGNESYIGNPELCGFPLTQSCDRSKTTNVEVLVDEVTESDYWYVSIAPGFVLGFWIVWGTLFLKKKWKDAYFRYVDYVYDAIFVAIAVNINRFKRKLGNEIASG